MDAQLGVPLWTPSLSLPGFSHKPTLSQGLNCKLFFQGCAGGRRVREREEASTERTDPQASTVGNTSSVPLGPCGRWSRARLSELAHPGGKEARLLSTNSLTIGGCPHGMASLSRLSQEQTFLWQQHTIPICRDSERQGRLLQP